ncbi:hypothetical protein AB0H83_35040 [Dactylosporangium sp. NPDC050688]|uniref:hypothetical protein n=1 Tax=Dactylosporangium sp. NPDC050688 TaxID=3157217 RepID=UPI003409F03B
MVSATVVSARRCSVLMKDVRAPDAVPMLSRGKHRHPGKGACFMELASFLAGGRWSDHPVCTHPLLAEVARLVNDNTSDAGRQQLAGLVPSVIGLVSADLRVDARIALRLATATLPVVAAERQCAMAVSVLACDHMLAVLDGRSPDTLEKRSQEALAQAPRATRWAGKFTRGVPAASAAAFRRRVAPHAVRSAVEGVAATCTPHRDRLLRALLVDAIEECAAWVGREEGRRDARSSGAGRS